MKKKFLLISAVAFSAMFFLNTQKVSSKQGFAPIDSCGDPVTNQTCARGGCHGGSAQNATAQNLTLTIGTGTPTTPLDPSFQYVGGTQYNIGFLINAFTGRYGFQIVALDAANAQAGTMTVSNAATTKINSSGGRQYMGHLNASSTKNWTFKWTAPQASAGPVSFYYAFATEDGDNNPGSNVIYKGTVTIDPVASSIEDINTKMNDLRIYPNPVESDLTVSLNIFESENVSADIYSMDGSISRNLFNAESVSGAFSKSNNISDLPTGIYLLKLNVGSASVTKKVFKQ